MKKIVADASKCSGCRLCELTCSFAHERQFRPSVARITVVKQDRFGLDLPVLCWNCATCSPMENCPSAALERNEQGLITVNEEKCSGCGKCAESCPMGAIKLHSEKNIPLICDQCGGKPLCVEKCPTKALEYARSEASQPKLPDEITRDMLRRWKMIA